MLGRGVKTQEPLYYELLCEGSSSGNSLNIRNKPETRETNLRPGKQTRDKGDGNTPDGKFLLPVYHGHHVCPVKACK